MLARLILFCILYDIQDGLDLLHVEVLSIILQCFTFTIYKIPLTPICGLSCEWQTAALNNNDTMSYALCMAQLTIHDILFRASSALALTSNTTLRND